MSEQAELIARDLKQAADLLASGLTTIADSDDQELADLYFCGVLTIFAEVFRRCTKRSPESEARLMTALKNAMDQGRSFAESMKVAGHA